MFTASQGNLCLASDLKLIRRCWGDEQFATLGIAYQHSISINSDTLVSLALFVFLFPGFPVDTLPLFAGNIARTIEIPVNQNCATHPAIHGLCEPLLGYRGAIGTQAKLWSALTVTAETEHCTIMIDGCVGMNGVLIGLRMLPQHLPIPSVQPDDVVSRHGY